MDVLYGLHPVEEAVRSGGGRLERVLLARERGDARLERLARLCRESGVRISMETRDQLTRMARTDAHQGALALVRERSFLALDDLLALQPQQGTQRRFFLALDGVEDPHNLGALLRTADGAGVDGVVLPERRSAPVSATVAPLPRPLAAILQLMVHSLLIAAQLYQEGLVIFGELGDTLPPGCTIS